MSSNRLSDNRWRKRIFRYAPFLFWLAVITYNSSSQASMNETSRFVRPLLEFLFPAASETTLVIYHSYIRKSAHLFEYAVLGFFASRAFWSSSFESLARYWYVFAIAVVLTIASLDEINQSFDSTRTGSTYDVILDSLGGFAMVVSLMAYKRYRNN